MLLFWPLLLCRPLPMKAEDRAWLNKGKWDAFYDGSHAPHLAGRPAVDDVIATLPWRSHSPTSQVVEHLASQHAPGSRARALELGCGTGENLVVLADHCAFVCGLDIAERACDAAAATLRAAGRDAQVVCADVLAIEDESTSKPLADGGPWSFDLVVDVQTFHCVRQVDARAAARAWARLVAPGGTLLLLTGSSDEPTDRGPSRMTREEVAGAFDGTALHLEALEGTHFDPSETYRRQPFEKPPLGWLSRWRKAPS
jgi:SAM-dependent methyltransferase